MKKMKVALIGCGMISGIYLKNLKSYDAIELVGCADLIPARAEARAAEFGIRPMTDEEIWGSPDIELVVNTTYPLAHYEVARQSLLAGKHVYTEKLTTETVAQADELLALAKARGLFVGGAPDTFLDGSTQLARRILDSGILGTPVLAEATLCRSYRHERFYAGDEKRFAFCRHGGILFDMGGYYLTELIFLLGDLARVSGFARIREPNRVYRNPNCPLYGQPITVESWNHATGSLEFASGVLGQITMTSESGAGANRFVIYGTDGSIDLGDPNNYENSVKIRNKKGEESTIFTSFGYSSGNNRGIGVLDAVYAIRQDRPARCSGEMNRHVLEAALGIVESSETGTATVLKTRCGRPAPLAVGYTENQELVFAEKG